MRVFTIQTYSAMIKMKLLNIFEFSQLARPKPKVHTSIFDHFYTKIVLIHVSYK